MEDDNDQPTAPVHSIVNVDHIRTDVSLHAVKEQASARAWEDIRSLLCRAAVESSAMPEKQQCIMCIERALYRCCECGSNAYYCHKCFTEAHHKVNVLHVGEIWEVTLVDPSVIVWIIAPLTGWNVSVGVDDNMIDVHLQHESPSKTSLSLCCIDGHGNYCYFITLTVVISFTGG